MNKFIIAIFSVACSATLISEQPDTPVHMEDGHEKFHQLVPYSLPQGLAVRVLKGGVSSFNLFGLSPISIDQFQNIIKRISQARGVEMSLRAPFPRIHPAGYGIWVVECFNDNNDTIGTAIVHGFEKLKSSALWKCRRVHYIWKSVERAIVSSSESLQFGGFRAYFRGMDSYEFATLPSSQSLVDRMTTVIY